MCPRPRQFWKGSVSTCETRRGSGAPAGVVTSFGALAYANVHVSTDDRFCALTALSLHEYWSGSSSSPVTEVSAVVFDVALECGAGLAFGLMYPKQQLRDYAAVNMMLSLGLCLTVGLGSLRVFGAERVVYWREASPGAGMALSRAAYFLAKNAVELPRRGPI